MCKEDGGQEGRLGNGTSPSPRILMESIEDI